MTDPLARMRSAATFAIVLAGAAAAAQPPGSADLLDLMAQGKAETDLGRYDTAIRALSAVVDAPAAPATLRDEARIRLGAARRAAGDFEGGLADLWRAARSTTLDRDTKALLVQALGGALPADKRWAEVWPRVSFAVDRSEPHKPTLAIVWPDVPPGQGGKGETITVRLQNTDIQNVFRLIADVSGLNVVVFPGVRGKVSVNAVDMPWERLLGGMLSANGLAYRRQDNVLLIAAPESLSPERSFTAARGDVEFQDTDLAKALSELAARAGATVKLGEGIGGRVTLRLVDVRLDQAFDIVVHVNGLEWSEEGTVWSVSKPR